MGDHPTAYEQDDESDNTYQNYNTYHHVIVTVNFSLRIDKAYVPTGIIQGATWNNGTNEGFVEHITVDTVDAESLKTRFVRHDSLSSFTKSRVCIDHIVN